MTNEIARRYKEQQAKGIGTRKELNIYNVSLTNEQKIIILKFMVLNIDKDLEKVTNKRQRISRLAEKQVLEECVDILEKYYAVEQTKAEER